MIPEIEKLRVEIGAESGRAPFPDEVAQSWLRCLDAYNLQPDVARRVDLLTYQELQQRLDAQGELVAVAQVEIDRLFQRLVDNEYMVSLASPEGIKILYRCDHVFLGEMSQLGVLPGSIWSEELRGTNGIGTCIKLGHSLSIIGDQHFDQNCRSMTCTVAPIFGRGGAIESVVNVTSPRPVDEKTARIVRNIVERTARRIENRYFVTRNRDLRTVSLSQDQDCADIALEGRIALDDSGRIVDATSLACKLLDLGRDDLIGSDIDSVMDFRQPLQESRPSATELASRPSQSLYATLNPHPAPGTARRGGGVALPQPVAGHDAAQDSDRILMHARLVEQVTAARRLFTARIPVLIEGETGTGKTAFARMLAQDPAAGAANVVALNCASLTGDDQSLDRLGNLSNVVLVLDQVDEAAPAAQARLLQILADDDFLETRNIRLVSVASRKLSDCVQNGEMRPDLYYRLKGAVVTLEPLRTLPNRAAIIEAAIRAEAATQQREHLTLDDGARLILANHHWPGNMRELRQAARHSVVLAQGSQIGISDLPEQIVAELAHKNLSARSQSEASRIEAALKHHNGNVSETARYLGISRATLYRKIQIKNIRIPLN